MLVGETMVKNRTMARLEGDSSNEEQKAIILRLKYRILHNATSIDFNSIIYAQSNRVLNLISSCIDTGMFNTVILVSNQTHTNYVSIIAQ